MNSTCHHVFMKKERHHIILPGPEYIARALQGGGDYFLPPPLVFLRYLPKLRTDHRQIFNTLQAINLTHPDKRKTR